MKKRLLLMVVFWYVPSFGQEVIIPETKYTFKEITPTLFVKDDRILAVFSFGNEVKSESMLTQDKNRLNHLKTTIEFEKPSDLKIVQKIDYQQMFFGCPPANSKDMMISSVKNYLLNKYVFSLLLNNVYE